MSDQQNFADEMPGGVRLEPTEITITFENPQDAALDFHRMALKAIEKNNPWMAYDLFLSAVQADPTQFENCHNVALYANLLSRPFQFFKDQALAFEQAFARAGNGPSHWAALGEMSIHCFKYAEGIAALEKANELEPTHAEWWTSLGFAHAHLGHVRDALECYGKAHKLAPDNGHIHFLISCASGGDFFDPQKQAFHGEQAFKGPNPSFMKLESCWNSAHGYLVLGDYKKGWDYFEARLKRNLTNRNEILTTERFKQPLWRGEKNIRLCVQTEMGFGDTFAMVRFLPIIKKKFNVDIQFECHPGMIDLMRYNFPDIKCVPYGEMDHSSFDYHIPTMSLPFICKTRTYSVPWDGPYIKAEPHKIEEWHKKLKLCDMQRNIGVCWYAGQRAYHAANHETFKRKSVPWEQFKMLLDTKGCNFVSLQTEKDAGFENLGIKDFSDTAAIIHLMGRVISVDTSVANLAGAMGKDLWLMDRFDHCWRWVDVQTPWYPTARVFRQAHPWVWDDVLEKIKSELQNECDKIAA